MTRPTGICAKKTDDSQYSYQAPPEGAVWLDGIMYKIGVHGKVFKFLDGKWLSSTKCKTRVQLALKKTQSALEFDEFIARKLRESERRRK